MVIVLDLDKVDDRLGMVVLNKAVELIFYD